MKYFKGIAYISTLLIIGVCTAQLEIPWEATIYNDNQNQYIDASDISNPIRDGAYTAIQSPDNNEKITWVQGTNNKIEDHKTAQTQTLQIIKNLINYALGMVSLVALVYLIYHGIIIITAAGDDAQYKKWLKGIKFATIALIWIGFSWIIVSSVFRIINTVLLKAS